MKFFLIGATGPAGRDVGGLDVPSSGEVHFGDLALSVAAEAELTRYRREYVGFVFQFYTLIPSLTVFENTLLVTDVAPHYRSPRPEAGAAHRRWGAGAGRAARACAGGPVHPDNGLSVVGIAAALALVVMGNDLRDAMEVIIDNHEEQHMARHDMAQTSAGVDVLRQPGGAASGRAFKLRASVVGKVLRDCGPAKPRWPWACR